MRIGEMLDGAFKLLRAAWAPSFVIVIVLVGPLDVLTGWVQDLVGITGFGATPAGQPLTGDDLDTLIDGLAAVGGLFFLTLLVSAVANGAVTRAAVVADSGRRPSWTEAVGHAFRRAWPLVGSTLVVVLLAVVLLGIAVGIVVGLAVTTGPVGAVLGVLVALGMLVPGLLLFAIFYLSVPIIVIEDAGPITALRRSAALVRPQVWRVVGIAILTSLAINLAVSSVSVAGSFVAFTAGPAGGLVAGLFAVVQRLLVLPVSAFVALLLYIDARTRREGLDLEARIARLPAPLGP